MWIDGLRAKYYGEGKRYGKPELDKILNRYDALTDMPCVLFTEELIEAYPDTKVVLTIRDEDSWLKSVQVLFNTLTSWNWGIVGSFNKLMILDYAVMIQTVWDIWTGGDPNDDAKLRETFRDHYALVRAKVPKDRLLEFHPSQGWEPLCKHLGIEAIPEEPYPNLNDLAFTIEIFKMIWWATATQAAKDIAYKALLPAAVLVGGGMWYCLSL